MEVSESCDWTSHSVPKGPRDFLLYHMFPLCCVDMYNLLVWRRPEELGRRSFLSVRDLTTP